LTAGLGGMGGAQPLAVTMNEGVALCVEVDPERLARRLDTAYLDERADDLADATARVERAAAEGRAVSVGLVGNAADVFPELLAAGVRPDVVTDQTSAHDPLGGYVPSGIEPGDAPAARAEDPAGYVKQARESMARHCEAMGGFQRAGAEVFDYGNNLRGEARVAGFGDAFAYPGFVPAYIRPLFCEGKGPFRWAALSGDPADIARTDRAVLELFGDDDHLRRWLAMAAERGRFPGPPGRGPGPDRDRPRPPGFRVGGQPLPGDRGHGRRQRRHRRLADPERPAQHRLGRLLGERPPRRRGRHRPLPPRRRGGGGRRVRGGGPAGRAGPHQRPRHRGHAPRRRRLRPGPGGGGRAGDGPARGHQVRADFLLTGIGQLVTCDPALGEGPLGVVERAAVRSAEHTSV